MNHDLANQTKAFARSLGFDDVGIASVDGGAPFKEQVEKAAQEGRFGPLDYLENTLTTRLDLRSAFPTAKSVVVVVKNYYTGDHPQKDALKAKIARYAWGKDYHQWFKKRLKKFQAFLEAAALRPVKVWPFNDTSPFLERAWAFKAGLGFIGKSAMFIHRGYGTWTLLGGLATDLDLASDPAYQGPDCGSCNKCLTACPTQAIIAPHTVDANRCIATWTIERPLHENSIHAAPRNHTWAFGCDICQEVCPWNKFQVLSQEERFQALPGRVFLTRETLEQDLAGSPLYRSRKSGLLATYLRIKNSLSEPHLKIWMGK